VLVAVIGLPLSLVAEWGFTRLAGPRDLPVGEAKWIWTRHATRWTGPDSFLVVRDFELRRPPREARLVILADEEYIIWINGALVGSGRYRPGDALDQYAVAEFLRSGHNRLLVELRSSRGLGGFFANLHFPAPSIGDVGTDERWRVSPAWRRELLKGLGQISSLEPAWELGNPPFGRWGPEAMSAVRAPLHEVIRPRGISARVRWDSTLGGRWVASERDAPARRIPVMRVDFGHEVEGLVVLGFGPSRPPPGLLYLGDRPPDPDEQSPAALVILGRKERYWQDVEMRRFRYALVLGMPGLDSFQIYPYAGTPPPSWHPVPLTPMRGVFGLVSPELRTPAEDKVWRELQGLASGR
jgi:hypothetical protein